MASVGNIRQVTVCIINILNAFSGSGISVSKVEKLHVVEAGMQKCRAEYYKGIY